MCSGSPHSWASPAALPRGPVPPRIRDVCGKRPPRSGPHSPGERLPHNGDVIEVSPAHFEELVVEALEAVPTELARLVDNVVFVIEADGPPEDPDLLGLYEGIALTERDATYAGALPDRITIYRNPTLRICETYEDVVEEVNITVVHEIAHHFGIDDDRLHDLGYD